MARDITNTFNAWTFDLDSDMVKRAGRRNLRRPSTTGLWAGNVRRIPVPDASYDAVFNFGVIHHVVDWRAALGEVFRVLKPGGRFYCEEITHPLLSRLMAHPQQDRFEGLAFREGLSQAGFDVHGVREMGDLYLWVIAVKPV